MGRGGGRDRKVDDGDAILMFVEFNGELNGAGGDNGSEEVRHEAEEGAGAGGGK